MLRLYSDTDSSSTDFRLLSDSTTFQDRDDDDTITRTLSDIREVSEIAEDPPYEILLVESPPNSPIQSIHSQQQTPQSKSSSAISIQFVEFLHISKQNWSVRERAKWYISITIAICLYSFAFGLYVICHDSHCSKMLFGIDISYLNIYNITSILMYSLLISLCFKFGNDYRNRRISEMLRTRIITKKQTMCSPISFYFDLFRVDWSEFGIICVINVIYNCFTALLLISQISDNRLDLITHLLTGFRFCIGSVAITLPSIAFVVYHDNMREVAMYSRLQHRKSINEPVVSSNMQSSTNNNKHETSKSLQSTDELSSSVSSKYNAFKCSILDDIVIQFGLFMVYFILLISMQMLPCLNFANYKHLNHVIYGSNISYKSNNYFIFNELVMKQFVAILLLNTIFHIISVNNHTYDPNHKITYRFISEFVSPYKILSVCLLSLVEIKVAGDASYGFYKAWNLLWLSLYLWLIVFIGIVIHFLIIKRAQKMTISTDSGSCNTILKNMLDGFVLLSINLISASFLLVNDDNWDGIRMMLLSILNVMQVYLLFTVKSMKENRAMSRYLRNGEKWKYLLQFVCVFNIYHLFHAIVFLANYYSDLWFFENENNNNSFPVFAKISFSFGFVGIQFHLWMFFQFLGVLIEIFQEKCRVFRRKGTTKKQSRSSAKPRHQKSVKKWKRPNQLMVP